MDDELTKLLEAAIRVFDEMDELEETDRREPAGTRPQPSTHEGAQQ